MDKRKTGGYLLDSLDEVVAQLIFVGLDDIALEFFVGNVGFLSVLDSSLVRLQLCERLFFQLALFLLLEILDYLLISLAFKNHFLSLNFLQKSAMKLFCLALVQSFLHLDLFFLDLLLVFVVFVVVCLSLQLLLDALQSLVLFLLKQLSIFLGYELLFNTLLFKSILIFHVFDA